MIIIGRFFGGSLGDIVLVVVWLFIENSCVNLKFQIFVVKGDIVLLGLLYFFVFCFFLIDILFLDILVVWNVYEQKGIMYIRLVDV